MLFSTAVSLHYNCAAMGPLLAGGSVPVGVLPIGCVSREAGVYRYRRLCLACCSSVESRRNITEQTFFADVSLVSSGANDCRNIALRNVRAECRPPHTNCKCSLKCCNVVGNRPLSFALWHIRPDWIILQPVLCGIADIYLYAMLLAVPTD